MVKSISKPTAVVVGFDISGLGLVRSLIRSGAHVIAVIDSPSNDGLWSRFGTKIKCLDQSANALTECLLSIGKTLNGEKAAMFLTSDDHVTEVSRNRGVLSDYFEFSLPDNKALTTLIDKVCFAKYAEAQNLPVPKTFCVNSAQKVADISSRIEYPCVLKPHQRTPVWIKQEFPKVFKIANAKELKETYKMIAPYNSKSIIQEWVPGGDDNIYFCLIYRLADSDTPVYFTGRKIRQWPSGTGSTSMAIPCEDPGIVKTSLKLFNDLGARGFCSVEYKLNTKSGRLLIMEPTIGRIDLQSGLADAAEVALPYYALCDMLGLSLPTLKKHPRPVNWLCEPYEIHNILHDIRAGKFSTVKWIRSIKGRRRYALFAWNDPLPLIHYFYTSAKHLIYKLLSILTPYKKKTDGVRRGP